MIMKASATLIFALILVTSSLGSSQAATLRGKVTVDAEFVLLGDIFTGVGGAAGEVVASAPTPGQNEIFSRQRLWGIAREHNLDWTPGSRYDRVTVERAGRPIARSHIEARIRQALTGTGISDSDEIQLTKRNLDLYAATGTHEPFTVRNAYLDVRTGRFGAQIVIPTGSKSAERVQVTGMVYAMTEVPVLARRMRRNEIIQREDVLMVRLRGNRVDRNAILHMDRIVGMSPRRLISSRTPLRAGDLRRPVVVTKGSLVMLVIRTNRMLLTAKGHAAHDAAMGEAVRVVNTRTKNTVEGIVEAPNRVAVSFLDAIR